MQHDLIYSAGSDRLQLMFGSSSSSMTSIAAAVAAAGEVGGGAARPRLKCPRCDSLNTKFCYYNNYNLSQPRHFCKSCRRYWTKGGILRNVPVGGGSRRSGSSAGSSSSKRSSGSSSSSKNLRRNQMLQHGGRDTTAPFAGHPAGLEGSPTPSFPEAFTYSLGIDSLHDAATAGFIPAPPGLSEESCSGAADLISTSAGLSLSPPHPASDAFATTTVVVDGPSVDDLMMTTDVLFPFDLAAAAVAGDPFQVPAQVEDVTLEFDELGGAMEFVDQTVPAVVMDDNTLGAVVIGACKNEQQGDREEDVSSRATAPAEGAPVASNHVDNWHGLPHVPLASDHIYFDYDQLATVGVTVTGGEGAIDDNQRHGEQQHEQQLNLEQQAAGGLLWDNTNYYCHQWGGIEIDQSILDLL